MVIKEMDEESEVEGYILNSTNMQKSTAQTQILKMRLEKAYDG